MRAQRRHITHWRHFGFAFGHTLSYYAHYIFDVWTLLPRFLAGLESTPLPLGSVAHFVFRAALPAHRTRGTGPLGHFTWHFWVLQRMLVPRALPAALRSLPSPSRPVSNIFSPICLNPSQPLLFTHTTFYWHFPTHYLLFYAFLLLLLGLFAYLLLLYWIHF